MAEAWTKKIKRRLSSGCQEATVKVRDVMTTQLVTLAPDTPYKKVVEQIKPKRYIIPMHYGTKVYDDLVKADEFLEDQKEGTVKTFKLNEMVVDTDAAVPKDPIIAVLNYEQKEEKPKDK